MLVLVEFTVSSLVAAYQWWYGLAGWPRGAQGVCVASAQHHSSDKSPTWAERKCGGWGIRPRSALKKAFDYVWYINPVWLRQAEHPPRDLCWASPLREVNLGRTQRTLKGCWLWFLKGVITCDAVMRAWTVLQTHAPHFWISISSFYQEYDFLSLRYCNCSYVSYG